MTGTARWLVALAAVVLDVSRRYHLGCAATGVTWLLPGVVAGTSWLHRALMVAVVPSFSDGRLRRPLDSLVVLGVAAADLLPRRRGLGLLAGEPALTYSRGTDVERGTRFLATSVEALMPARDASDAATRVWGRPWTVAGTRRTRPKETSCVSVRTL